jgi:hypothetical protein
MATTVKERVNKHRMLQREKARLFDALSAGIFEPYEEFLRAKEKYDVDLKFVKMETKLAFAERSKNPDYDTFENLTKMLVDPIEKLAADLISKVPNYKDLLAEPQNTEQNQPVADNVVPLKAQHSTFQYPWPVADAIAVALESGFSEERVYASYLIKAGMRVLKLVPELDVHDHPYDGEVGLNTGVTSKGKIMKLPGVKLPTSEDNLARYQAEEEQKKQN